ncbi:MAG: hypothetical protein KBF97_04170, partial [Bacteroidetes bacterium]|nr:hypothetical protein [Bacteroidota bacterium]
NKQPRDSSRGIYTRVGTPNESGDSFNSMQPSQGLKHSRNAPKGQAAKAQKRRGRNSSNTQTKMLTDSPESVRKNAPVA